MEPENQNNFANPQPSMTPAPKQNGTGGIVGILIIIIIIVAGAFYFWSIKKDSVMIEKNNMKLMTEEDVMKADESASDDIESAINLDLETDLQGVDEELK